jgi:hypothetical protein
VFNRPRVHPLRLLQCPALFCCSVAYPPDACACRVCEADSSPDRGQASRSEPRTDTLNNRTRRSLGYQDSAPTAAWCQQAGSIHHPIALAQALYLRVEPHLIRLVVLSVCIEVLVAALTCEQHAHRRAGAKHAEDASGRRPGATSQRQAYDGQGKRTPINPRHPLVVELAKAEVQTPEGLAARVYGVAAP